MTLRLNGSTSGYTEIDAPAVAGSNTLRLPTGNGSDGNILGTDGAGNLSWADRGRMVLATAQNTTSGTSIDFTGIPSWAKRVTVMFNGVSLSGTSSILIRLGDSGGIENTGYTSASVTLSATNAVLSSTAGFLLRSGSATRTATGSVFLNLVGSNIWTSNGQVYLEADAVSVTAGSKTLSDTFTQLRITTVNGTDTFDAGSINILYE